MKKVLLSLGVVATMAMVSCGGPSVCDCVNLDEEKADESTVKACEEMKDEWEKKYEEASDDDKKAMMEEIKECMADSEESGDEH